MGMGAEHSTSSGRAKPFTDQMSAVVVQSINDARAFSKATALAAQDEAFAKAIGQIEWVRKFLGTPSNILGNPLTKHGEIAERVEVGIRNARSALHQQEMTATLPKTRIGPEDYIIDGIGVQSKFINGVNNNLEHVLKHMGNYPNFEADGSYYHIPKDTHETIVKVIRGDFVDKMAPDTRRAILNKVHEIEAKTGKPFVEVVKPGVSSYPEVQQGKVHTTLDRHEGEITGENDRIKEGIVEDHAPSLSGALGAAAAGAAVGATLTLTASIYAKYKEGKNVFRGDFSMDDWKSVGLDLTKGAGGGAIAAGSIYVLTNWAEMSAPFAGAVVSAAKGVSALVAQYSAGSISFEQFLDLGLIVCAESAIVGTATAIGQTLIPIPMVGAVIGSVAGKLLAELVSSQSTEIARRVQEDMDAFLTKVDAMLAEVLISIRNEFDRIGSLTEAAFDLHCNTKLLMSSVHLAEHYGVREELIITDTSQLDDFMLA